MTGSPSGRPRLAVGGTYAASWPTLALYAVPSFWVNLLYDQTRLGGNGWAWLGVSALAYAATIIPIAVARYTVLPVDPRRAPRPLVALGVYLVAAVTRVAVAVPLGMSWGIFPREELTYRIFSAPLNVVFWMVLITALVEASLHHRSRMRELQLRRSELKQLKSSIDAVVANDIHSVRDTVMSALEPSLTLLRDRVVSPDLRHAAHVVIELQSAIDDVVRPLSDRIAHSTAGRRIVDEHPVRSGRWWGIPLRIRVRDVLKPGTVALITLYSGFVPTLALLGWHVTAFVVVPTAAITWCVGVGAQRIWGHRELPVGGPFLAALGVYSLAGLIAAALAMITFPSIPSALVAQYGLTIVAIGLTVALFGLVTVTRENAQADMAETNAALDALTAEMRQRLWVSRSHLAATLHGPVQAAFQVAALRIARATEITPELIVELDDAIRDSLSLLGTPAVTDGEDVLQLRDDLVSMWATVCDISIDIDPVITSSGVAHTNALRCVIEVLRESVTNAVKHGSATLIHIAVESDPTGITVIARNNGNPPPSNPAPGFGFHTIGEFAQAWSLSTDGPDTVLLVRIPLAADDHA